MARFQLPQKSFSITSGQVDETVNLKDPEDAVKYMPSLFVRKRNDGDNMAVLATRSWGVNSSARSLIYYDDLLVSALIVTLFFGGWHGPWLPPILWFALKTGFFLMLFILLRASLPRPRYDRVMSFGWKVCLPLTLTNLLATGAVMLLVAE